MSIQEYIPPQYRLAVIIFFALFPWLLVGAVAFKAWRIAVKKRHGALAYRALEERCRCIVDAVADSFPALRELRGSDFTDAVKAKLSHAAQVLASIESKNLPAVPPLLRWYVQQVKSIQHHLTEAEYAGADANPAGVVLHMLNMDRAIYIPTFLVALKESNLKPRVSKYGVEEMEKQFRETIGKLAMYARQVTFCDSLRKFTEDVMDVALVENAKRVIKLAKEAGCIDQPQFIWMTKLAEEKPL